MSQLSASALETLRGRLLALRDGALKEAWAAETRGLSLLETTGGEIEDQAERAEIQREKEIGKAEAAGDYAIASAAEAALRRIAEGSYGICRDCGDAIPQARLFAIPVALRCSACQRVYEQRLAKDKK